jgi:mono/diheme cytochrome c family protein
MSNRRIHLAVAAIVAAMPGICPHNAAAANPQVERGKYLVMVAGCSDCHTPGGLTGTPDATRYLGGSDVGFAIPGEGVFVGRNLTPDKATGLGNWTAQQIVEVLTTGVRPDGRILSPAMPWETFSHLTRSDALAIVAYLKSLPPVKNEVAGPFGPKDKPSVLVMAVLPGDVYAGLPQPGAPPKP